MNPESVICNLESRPSEVRPLNLESVICNFKSPPSEAVSSIS